MLRIRPSSSTGMRMATMIIMPPIVGTPFFSTPNGSMLASRCTSEMLRRFMYFMKRSPNHAEITKDSMSVSSDLNEMYAQMCEPGMSYWSKNLKR